jgi:hypothetical protein
MSKGNNSEGIKLKDATKYAHVWWFYFIHHVMPTRDISGPPYIYIIVQALPFGNVYVCLSRQQNP